MPAPIKYLAGALAGLFALFAILAVWPCALVASPASHLRVVDDSRHPLTGVRIVRGWHTSESHQGEDEAHTDASGAVSFPRKAVRISMLKRLTKPLLVFVPAACGPAWEIYGYSEYRIYWPDGYTLMFDDPNWKKTGEAWQRSDGLCIRDPEIARKYQRADCVELYGYNMRHDFDYALTVYRKGK